MVEQYRFADTPDDLATLAHDRLLSYGWEPHQAAGIVGNLWHESGGMNPRIVGDKGASIGLAQWNNERRRALEQYAANKGTDPDDFYTQVDFVNHELNTTEAPAGEALRQTQTPYQATKVFSNTFERPGKPAMGSRLSATRRILNLLGMPSEAEAAEPGGNGYRFVDETPTSGYRFVDEAPKVAPDAGGIPPPGGKGQITSPIVDGKTGKVLQPPLEAAPIAEDPWAATGALPVLPQGPDQPLGQPLIPVKTPDEMRRMWGIPPVPGPERDISKPPEQFRPDLAGVIGQKKAELDTFGTQIAGMKQAMEAGKAKLDAPGATQADVDAYNAQINAYNAKVGQYEKARQEHNQGIEQYKALFGQYQTEEGGKRLRERLPQAGTQAQTPEEKAYADVLRETGPLMGPRGGVFGVIDKAIDLMSKGASWTTPEMAQMGMAVHGAEEVPTYTPEEQQQIQRHTATVLSSMGKGFLSGRTFGLYQPPPGITEEEKRLGADWAQTIGFFAGIGGAIKDVAKYGVAPIMQAAGIIEPTTMAAIKAGAVIPTGIGIGSVAAASGLTGVLWSALDRLGNQLGAYAAGQPIPPAGHPMSVHGAMKLAEYLGRPDIAEGIENISRQLGPAAMGMEFATIAAIPLLGLRGFESILKAYRIRSSPFWNRSEGRWKTQEEYDKDWRAANPEKEAPPPINMNPQTAEEAVETYGRLSIENLPELNKLIRGNRYLRLIKFLHESEKTLSDEKGELLRGEQLAGALKDKVDFIKEEYATRTQEGVRGYGEEGEPPIPGETPPPPGGPKQPPPPVTPAPAVPKVPASNLAAMTLDEFKATAPVIAMTKPKKDENPVYNYVRPDGEVVPIQVEKGEGRGKAIEKAWQYEVGLAKGVPTETPVPPVTEPAPEPAQVPAPEQKVARGAKETIQEWSDAAQEATKEGWKLNVRTFLREGMWGDRQAGIAEHKRIVEEALASGKLTREQAKEIGHFKDYPDLAAKAAAVPEALAPAPAKAKEVKSKAELEYEIRLLESQRKSKGGYFQSQTEQKRISREIDNLRAQMPEDAGAQYRSLLSRYRKYRKGPEEGLKYGQDETLYAEYKKTFAQDLINAAEKAGQPTPKEVLADYPDLAAKAAVVAEGKGTEFQKISSEIQYREETPPPISEKDRKEEAIVQKQFAIDKVQEAFKNHPNAPPTPEFFKKRDEFGGKDGNRFNDTPPDGGPQFIEFHVPGDGSFKIVNSLKSLYRAEKFFKKWLTGKAAANWKPGSVIDKGAEPLSEQRQQQLIASYEEAKKEAGKAIRNLEKEAYRTVADREQEIWLQLAEISNKYKVPSSVLYREVYKTITPEEMQLLKKHGVSASVEEIKSQIATLQMEVDKRIPPKTIPEVKSGFEDIKHPNDTEFKSAGLQFIQMKLDWLGKKMTKEDVRERKNLKQEMAAIKKGDWKEISTYTENNIRSLAYAIKNNRILFSYESEASGMQRTYFLAPDKTNQGRNIYQIRFVETYDPVKSITPGLVTESSLAATGRTPLDALIEVSSHGVVRLMKQFPKEIGKIAAYIHTARETDIYNLRPSEIAKEIEQQINDLMERGDIKGTIDFIEESRKKHGLGAEYAKKLEELKPILKQKEAELAGVKPPAGGKFSVRQTRPKETTYEKVQAAVKRFLTGQERNPGTPEVREAGRRLLEDVKSRVREGTLGFRESDEPIIGGVEYSDSLANSKDFQKIQAGASRHGVSVLPVKNMDVAGVWLPGESPVILIDEDAGLSTHKKMAGHEIFHHRDELGDPTANEIVAQVDTSSPIFAAYRDVIRAEYKGLGYPEPDDVLVAKELAADYVSENPTYDLKGKPLSLQRAFKIPPLELKLRYQRAAPPVAGGVAEVKASRFAFREKGRGEKEILEEEKIYHPEIAGHEEGIKYLYSGFPPGPDTINLFKKILKTSQNVRRFAAMTPKEMSLLASYAELPFWRALENKEFSKVYEVQTTRENLRNWLNDEILSEIEPAIRWWKQTPETMRQNFRDAVWHFDKIRKEPLDAQLKEYRLDDEAIGHYRKMREVMDYLWEEDLSALLWNLGLPKNDIEALRRERGKIAGFFPHLREGKYFLYARTKGGDWTTRSTKEGKPVIYKSQETAEAAANFLNKNKPDGMARAIETPEGWTLQYKVKAKTKYFELLDDIVATITGGKIPLKTAIRGMKLEQEYPKEEIRAGKVRKLPEEAFWHVDTNNMQAIIDAAVRQAELPEGVEATELRKALLEAVANTLKTRGFGEHFIARKDVPGFDKSDPIKAVIRFVQSYHGFKTKLMASSDFRSALKGIDSKSRDWKYASKYVRDMLANVEAMDRVSDKLRAGFFVYFLGGVARQMLLQPTQNFIAFVPAIQEYSKWSTAKISTEMARASADFLKDLGVKAIGKEGKSLEGRTTENERIGLEVARKKGVLSDQLTREYGVYLLSTLGKVGRALMEITQFFIGNAEKYNRHTSYLVSYRVATKELGMSHIEAMRFAEKMVEMAHFRYGKANLPPIFRGGEMAKLIRSSYAFRSYNANLLRLYAHLGTGKTGKVGEVFGGKGKAGKWGVLKGFMALLAFGGLSSLFGYKWLEEKIQKWTGKNIRSEITKDLGGWAKYINYGLPAAVGIDLSGSLGMESPKSIGEVVGVPYSLYDIPKRVLEKTGKGDYYRALEALAPSALKGPMIAYRLGTEGATTGHGKTIKDFEKEPVKLTPYEAFLRSLSFRTVKEAEIQRRRELEKTATVDWQERRQNLLDEFRITSRRYGRESVEAEAVVDKHRKFNDDLTNKGIDYIPRITSKNRINAIKEKEGKYQRRLHNALREGMPLQ